MTQIFDCAIANGVNLFDLATRNPDTFSSFAPALAAARSDVSIQVHFGAEYSRGKYGSTMELDAIRRSISMQLDSLKTDYIDFGYMHCIDTAESLQRYIQNGVLDYVLELKKAGVVQHIGLSSHTPELVHQVLDMNIVDMIMFSINPAYDYRLGGYANGSSQERYRLYQRIEQEGVGLVVMKPFCGGRLLDAAYSPFPAALSRLQCLQYALDKPGVLSVLPGCRTMEDLQQILQYNMSSAREKDYSILQCFEHVTNAGCVYCGHCHPCPAELDIALINKYYDLSLQNDVLAMEHYHTLSKKAIDCLHCGECDQRCPFGVRQSQRMVEISRYFAT